MMRPRLFFLTTILCFAALSAWAADKEGGFFDVTDENDAWSDFLGKHQDRHYTHGIKTTLMLPEHALDPDSVFFPLWGMHRDDIMTSHGFVLGQNMYTPEDILDPNPIPTDHPYAGWLYTGLVYQRRGELSEHIAVLENFEVNLGVVGPLSLAGPTQRDVHRWRFPEDIPAGWGNQLKNEPGIVLKYARLWRWSPTTNTAYYFDIIPRVGGELGNVAIFATAGATLRIGLNLPQDFGMQIIDSPAAANGGAVKKLHWSVYAFASADERAIAHDITLDGNTFRAGPSVDKRNFVDDLTWGVAVEPCRFIELRYAHVNRSRQFHGQQGNDVFGSIDARFMFEF